MSKKFNYELQKGSKHVICPNCGKKTFKLYVQAGTNKVTGAQFGRCERINNCGYLQYPDFKGDFPPFQRIEQKSLKAPKFNIVPKKIVEDTFRNFNQNVFFKFLIKNFGREKSFELQEKYNIGTAKNGGTIFWQQDRAGKFRTGKVFYYNENGKRNKERHTWYIHNQVKSDFLLLQVFFGEHLTINTEKIALCESEKTAVMMSVFEPDFTWIASGGATYINDYKLNRIPFLTKVYPDEGFFNVWEKKTKHFNGRQMDVTVEHAVRDGLLSTGADILDLYLLEKQHQTI